MVLAVVCGVCQLVRVFEDRKGVLVSIYESNSKDDTPQALQVTTPQQLAPPNLAAQRLVGWRPYAGHGWLWGAEGGRACVTTHHPHEDEAHRSGMAMGRAWRHTNLLLPLLAWPVQHPLHH